MRDVPPYVPSVPLYPLYPLLYPLYPVPPVPSESLYPLYTPCMYPLYVTGSLWTHLDPLVAPVPPLYPQLYPLFPLYPWDFVNMLCQWLVALTCGSAAFYLTPSPPLMLSQ